jgi:C4-dicarboxylate transporter
VEQIVDSFKTISAIITAILLAIFAKRYSDLKKRKAELERQELENKKEQVIYENNATDLESLVERENKRDH